MKGILIKKEGIWFVKYEYTRPATTEEIKNFKGGPHAGISKMGTGPGKRVLGLKMLDTKILSLQNPEGHDLVEGAEIDFEIDYIHGYSEDIEVAVMYTEQERLIYNLQGAILSFYDTLMLYENGGLCMDYETLSQMYFRKFSGYDIDLKKFLNADYIEPFTKEEVAEFKKNRNESWDEIISSASQEPGCREDGGFIHWLTENFEAPERKKK